MVSTVARDGVEVTDLGEQGELYSVACIHCDKQVFRFSGSLFYDSGKATLVCPNCGGITEVTGNGRIQTG